MSIDDINRRNARGQTIAFWIVIGIWAVTITLLGIASVAIL